MTGSVEIEVERVSPATLVLRGVGKKLGRDPEAARAIVRPGESEPR
jgi:hypothetical protein